MSAFDDKTKELEEKIDSLYAEYDYLLSAGNLNLGDKWFSTGQALQITSSLDNFTRYTVMRFDDTSKTEGIDLAFNIWTTYGELLVFKREGQYKFVFRMPYSLPPEDVSLEDFFESVPTLEGEANEKLLDNIAMDMDGHNIEPIASEFLTANQLSDPEISSATNDH
jgi:hypothetical protein